MLDPYREARGSREIIAARVQQKKTGLGSAVWGSHSVLPTLLFPPLLSQPRALDDGIAPGAVSTLPPCSGRPGSLGKGPSPTQTKPERGLDRGLRAKGAGKG